MKIRMAARAFLDAEQAYVQDLLMRGPNSPTDWALFGRYLSARMALVAALENKER